MTICRTEPAAEIRALFALSQALVQSARDPAASDATLFAVSQSFYPVSPGFFSYPEGATSAASNSLGALA
jgi:hypothetical protein